MPSKPDRELFENLCYLDDYDAAHLLNNLSNQKRKEVLVWFFSIFCRGCRKKIDRKDFSIWITYWQGMLAPSHKNCLSSGMSEEAYECQCIDADCNDCLHFERISMNNGVCLKYDRPTTASPKMSTGYPCFEHRKNKNIINAH